MIFEVFLYSYLITTGISLLILPIKSYFKNKKELGIRMSIVRAFEIALYCFVPYISIIAVVYVIVMFLRSWVKNDPTSPKNIDDPNFKSPISPKKKSKPIDNRFDILDL